LGWSRYGDTGLSASSSGGRGEDDKEASSDGAKVQVQVLKCQKLVDFPDSDNGWQVCVLLQLQGGKECCTGATTDRINPKFAETVSLPIREAGRGGTILNGSVFVTDPLSVSPPSTGTGKRIRSCLAFSPPPFLKCACSFACLGCQDLFFF
jgi:hypothetical protein